MRNEKRIVQWDVIRIVCTLIIVCYHSSCEIYKCGNTNFLPFYNTSNGAWGAMMVTTFFALSGCTLWYAHKDFDDKNQVMEFYKHRIKDIMIPFWITWIIFYVFKSIMLKTPMWGGYWPKIILSFIGLDGYTLYLGKNYTLIGEWFFGAIVILYVLYPLVNIIFKKYRLIGTIVLFSIYFYIALWNPFKMAPYRNIATCLWTFWVGMLLCEYKTILSKNIVGIACVAVTCIVIFVHISLPSEFILVIGGISFFISTFYITTNVDQKVHIKVTPILYRASFMVYLMHHQMIYRTAGVLSGFLISEVAWIQSLLYAIVIYLIGCLYYLLYKKAGKIIISRKK